ncbi:Extended synaptotagmin-2-A [Liparis tanakae]|uniref:Extended synaptotagmin-2-A n=1 Tax=Liparis tanakae TaxID=230148 RepID=A0A4Z2H0H2_9TELE|nr:Extended synaptotagmin-2-A [Liparis tanakae]
MEGSVGPGVKANGPISPPGSPVSSGIGPPPFPEEAPQSPLTDITQMWMKFGKTFAVILPIYILGYFEFSFSWVLIGLAALFYWRKNHGGMDYRINRAMAFLEHEEKAMKHSVPMSELPPWERSFSSLGAVQLFQRDSGAQSHCRFRPQGPPESKPSTGL